jgi:hypothetical protein
VRWGLNQIQHHSDAKIAARTRVRVAWHGVAEELAVQVAADDGAVGMGT